MKRPIDIARDVPGPWPLACGLLEINPEELVRPAFDQIRVDLGETMSLGREVTFEHGPVNRDDHGSSILVGWQAASHPGLFPAMEGELRLRDAGNNATRVRLLGAYEPPLGSVGALGDAVAGHRFAERAANSFLDGFCRRLEDAIAEHRDAS